MNILIEHSKNDPIPEINRAKERLCVILYGMPAIGKTHFAKTFIVNKNKNMIHIDYDDISTTRLGGSDIYKKDKLAHKESTSVFYERMFNLIEGGNNIVIDTTGERIISDDNLFSKLKRNNYQVIILYFLPDINKAIENLKKRDRQVDIDYLYAKYASTKYIDKLKKLYSENTNLISNIYVLYQKYSNKYKIMKYDAQHNKLLKRSHGEYK